VDRETYRAPPEFITVREATIQVKQPGFRTKSMVEVTTSPDPEEATREDLAALYLARWNNELDLRAIKSTMQMNELRCKPPEMVHREIRAHVPACNLIRTVMAQAASKQDLPPRTIRFKGAIQILEAFQPVIELQSARGLDHLLRLYQDLPDAIASRKVGNRPGRFEPRAKKHRRNHDDFLMRPRAEIKRDLAKGVINIQVPFVGWTDVW
jgi:hypothetical protein